MKASLINWIWDALQAMHDRIGRYLNEKENLSLVEAQRWCLVTKPIMNLQEFLNENRCEWLESHEDDA